MNLSETERKSGFTDEIVFNLNYKIVSSRHSSRAGQEVTEEVRSRDSFTCRLSARPPVPAVQSSPEQTPWDPPRPPRDTALRPQRVRPQRAQPVPRGAQGAAPLPEKSTSVPKTPYRSQELKQVHTNKHHPPAGVPS